MSCGPTVPNTGGGGMLDRLLVAASVCVVAASIFYFFYWNRFVAWIIGLVIRVLYWRHGIWVEIGRFFNPLVRVDIFVLSEAHGYM